MPDPLDPVHLDYTTPATERQDRPDPTPLFGYIGLGIAVAAMLIGFAAMILFVLYFLRA